MEHECPGRPLTREQREEALEKAANRLLVDSLSSHGRGEYPFYSQSYLRRKGVLDERSLVADEAEHPAAPSPSAKIIWALARKARLTSIEMDVLRLVTVGEKNSAIARLLNTTAARVRRIADRAVAKMAAQVGKVARDQSEQIACVLRDEQERRAAQRETHCKPGQELCQKNGLCPRRWYLRDN